MTRGPAISVVVPALNEEKRLEAPLRETVDYFRQRGTPVEVIVVDDGSTDGTSALVRRLSSEFPEIVSGCGIAHSTRATCRRR